MTDLQIFKNAPQDVSPEELKSYLDGACGGDATLRARVEALFQAEAKAGGFMERPAMDGGPMVLDSSPVREGTVYWLAFHPKEPRLAIARDNGDIAIWDLAKIDRQLTELGVGVRACACGGPASPGQTANQPVKQPVKVLKIGTGLPSPRSSDFFRHSDFGLRISGERTP